MVSHTELGGSRHQMVERVDSEQSWIRFGQNTLSAPPKHDGRNVQKRAKEIWYIRRRWCHINQRDPKVTQAKQSHVTRRVDIIAGRAKQTTPSRVLGPEATFQVNARIQASEPKRISDDPRGGGPGKATSLSGEMTPRLANPCPGETYLSSRNKNTRNLIPELGIPYLLLNYYTDRLSALTKRGRYSKCGYEKAKLAWGVPASERRYHIRL